MRRERQSRGERAAEWFWFGPPPFALRDLAERVVHDEAGDDAEQLEPAARLDLVIETAVRSRDDEWHGRLVDAAVVAWPAEAEAKAAEMLRSRGWRRRTVAAELLATLCEYRPNRIPALVETLAAAFDRERDDRVLSLILVAFHHAANMEGVTPPARESAADRDLDWRLDMPTGPAATRTQPAAWEAFRGERLERVASLANHPDPDVRRRLAISLEGFDLGNPTVLGTLVGLTRDPDVSVRDWATFELAMAYDEADDGEVRSALAERRDDACADIRDEALYGLVMRHAPGAVAALAEALRGDDVSDYLVMAASDAEDPSLVPALRDLAKRWQEPDEIERIIEASEATARAR